jgi:hypothetical protein
VKRISARPVFHEPAPFEKNIETFHGAELRTRTDSFLPREDPGNPMPEFFGGTVRAWRWTNETLCDDRTIQKTPKYYML